MWAGKTCRRAVAQKHVTRKEFIAASDLPAFGEGGGRFAGRAHGGRFAHRARGVRGADAARACSGANQTFQRYTIGPILSTGGSITVPDTGDIDGDPEAIDVVSTAPRRR